MKYRRITAALSAALLVSVYAAAADTKSALKSITSRDGALLPVQVETSAGRVLFTLPAPDRNGNSGRFLYATQARSGLGSTDIRLDRGLNGRTQLISFRRVGKKVAIIYENPRFRAVNGTPEEQVGVSTSFAFVTAGMLDIVSTKPDGSLVVDASSFLASDVMNISRMLNAGEGGGFAEGTRISAGQGYKLVESASAVDPTSVKAFPNNVEVDSVETFQGDKPSAEIAKISPDPRRVSFIVHHSFIRLPEPGFVPRKFDIRAGGFSTQIFDFNQPLGKNIVIQLANHFRLEKIDPNAARSKVKKPIIFYVDNSIPEPMRSALAKGVGWWSQAFDAAGFIDGFQVKILPKDADPMDVRYNMVFWANRLTRSWSYGQEIVDPRTGEILRGAVVLGGDRVRQNINIFEGLVGTKDENTGGPNDPVRVALARLSQLGAHEVGHSIGFVHNFAGSTQDRTSVMEYPGPRIAITPNDKIDLSDAYAVGIGSWDKFTVDWLYGEAPSGTDSEALANDKITKMIASGTRFITDSDSRADNTPTPWASMWDDGPDPVAELPRMMRVRAIALSNFGQSVLHAGDPLADLRRKFVPIWLLHRYQLAAAAKSIGGMDYWYNVSNDALPLPRSVPNDMQETALANILATLDSKTLTVPSSLVDLMSAGIHGADNPQDDNEDFATAGAAVFDPLIATDIATQLTLGPLLEPLRLNRVYQQHSRNASLLGLNELLDKLLAATVEARHDAVGRRIAYRTLVALAESARDRETSSDVAALINARLEREGDVLSKAASPDGEDTAWAHSMARLLKNDAAMAAEIAKSAPRAPSIPMGMPIGGAETDWAENY
jgi:hypothetical protein